MTMCPNDSLYRWWTTQWTLDWLGVTPDKTNPFSFCVTEKLTFVNACYFPSSPGNVSLQYKIFSWEKSVPNTNRIIMVMRLAGFLFGRYRMGLLVSSSLYSAVSHTLTYRYAELSIYNYNWQLPKLLTEWCIYLLNLRWSHDQLPTNLYLPIFLLVLVLTNEKGNKTI